MDLDQLDSDKIALEIQEDIVEDTFEKRFGWLLVINRIASDDVTRHDQITSRGVIEILNQLTYILEKEKYIESMRKKTLPKG